jgi:hypothetical protein
VYSQHVFTTEALNTANIVDAIADTDAENAGHNTRNIPRYRLALEGGTALMSAKDHSLITGKR